jgi:hypothetical protein
LPRTREVQALAGRGRIDGLMQGPESDTNVEAGRLRAALREVLIDERRPHRAGAA